MLNLLNETSMPLEINIIILVIASIIGLWLLLLVVDIGFVFTFRTILKRHKQSLTVILNTKYLNLVRIFEIAKEHDLPIKEEINNLLSEIDKKGFEQHETELGEKTRTYLSYLGEEARFLVNRNKSVYEDGEGEIVRTNFKDNEVQLRSNIAMYNADVLGFNYWINFLPTRFVYKIFKIKKKDLIS